MAFSGMHGLKDYIPELLQSKPSTEDGDELVRAFSAKIVEDKAPKKQMTLQEHDAIFHKEGFDPHTMSCKFRDKMKQMTPNDAADLVYATSDVHMTGIEGITNKDCGTIVLAGDFMEKAKHQQHFKDAEKWWQERFLPWCEDHKDQQIVIIGGNCDKWLYNNRKTLEWPQNVHYLDDTATEVNGMKVYGTSWCPHNMNGAWEVDDEQLEKEFSKIPEGLDILVTHVPPKGDGLDLDHDTEFDSHFGSTALTKAILEKKPKIVLCGHIHSGSHKPTRIGDSIVMNVSRIDDDRYDQSFHGRKIGVERTDNGIGFLVDMEDEGRVALGKKEDVPQSIVDLRDALLTAAKSINGHIDDGSYSPNAEKIEAALKAIIAAQDDLKKFDHPKKNQIERAIKGLAESEESGWKKPMNGIGKLFEGDQVGKKHHYAEYGGGSNSVPYSQFTNKWGKYINPWKSGKKIAEILSEIANEQTLKPTILHWNEQRIEDSPFDEWGMPRKKKKDKL